MLQVRYSLDDFIADMCELVAAAPAPTRLFDRGSAYLERLAGQPEALPEQFRRPSGKGPRPNHGSYALHRSDGLFISAVIWGPGEHVGPHDHRTWGLIGVMGNGIQETRYRRIDDRSRSGFAELARTRTTLVRSGEVSILTPEVDEIHSMANDSDRPTVEVHVYGKDLVGLERSFFDLATGQVGRRRSGKFDNC